MGKILIATILFYTFWFATVPSLGQLSIGLHGGSNFSKMDFTNNQELRFAKIDNKQGFIGGVVFNFLGDKHAGVQAEINYSQKGWILNDTTSGNDIDNINQIDYIDVPILTHVNVGGGKFRGIFHIGPYIGYALSRKVKIKDNNTGAEESFDYQFSKSKDNQFDFGLIAGGGIEYKLPVGKIALEARYTFGFGDIDKEKVLQSEVSQFRILTGLLRYTVQVTHRNKEQSDQK